MWHVLCVNLSKRSAMEADLIPEQLGGDRSRLGLSETSLLHAHPSLKSLSLLSHQLPQVVLRSTNIYKAAQTWGYQSDQWIVATLGKILS